jgi:hypothetical protein
LWPAAALSFLLGAPVAAVQVLFVSGISVWRDRHLIAVIAWLCLSLVGAMVLVLLRHPQIIAPNVGPAAIRVLRVLARAASLVSLWLLSLFAFSGGNWPTAGEWLLIAFFPVGVAVGTLLAWHREVLGGAVAAASLVAFHVILLTAEGKPSPGPWFVVFASPALALLVCGLVTRRVGVHAQAR